MAHLKLIEGIMVMFLWPIATRGEFTTAFLGINNQLLLPKQLNGKSPTAVDYCQLQDIYVVRKFLFLFLRSLFHLLSCIYSFHLFTFFRYNLCFVADGFKPETFYIKMFYATILVLLFLLKIRKCPENLTNYQLLRYMLN